MKIALRKLGSTAINSFMRGCASAFKNLKNSIDQKITERNYLLGFR